MYRPPPTDATTIDPVTGNVKPVPPGAYQLFSSAADDAVIVPLMKALDANVQIEDAGPLGILLPPVIYGSDGRHITLMSGSINGIPYEETVGTLIAQQNYGPMWNEMRQPPYTKLFADEAAFSGPGGSGPGAIIEINWGH